MGRIPVRLGDLWGGLAAMLVALPSAIAFGIVVYSAVDPSLVARGAMFGMIGAAALGLIAPLTGGTPALITAPCAPAAAVLAALATSLSASGVDVARIPGLLALTALLAAGLQVFYGLVKGGRFIKYIPYPVVSGYLSGVGLIIALGQLPRLFGLPQDTSLLQGLIEPSQWQRSSLVVGVTTVVVMACGSRLTEKVPAAILALGAGMSIYLLIGFTSAPELLTLTNNALVIGPVTASGSFAQSVAAQLHSLREVRIEDIQLVGYAAVALSALLSIDTLKTCVVLDALTKGRHNSNRELLGQGIGNLAGFAAGGMPGAGTMGPTLVNVTSGGTTKGSGIAEGLFVVLAIVALSPLIAWVPIAVLAGILLVVAFRMFDWSAFKLLKYSDTRFDFIVIATVVTIAETVGLIAASGIGIALAILLFIRDQIRGSVLRKRATLREISSKTSRLEEEREILNSRGDLAAVLDLQGNLFFGTTDQLFTELKRELSTCRWLLFDLRRVQSMDYTAANLFRQMHGRLVEHGGALLFCGMPSRLARQQDIQRYLFEVGVLDLGDDAIRVFERRDQALEWIENRILEDAGWTAGEALQPLELDEIALVSDLDRATLEALSQCVRSRSVKAGKNVFSRGDSGDEIFLVRSGVVRILLPLMHGKQHHLATFSRGDYFGEMAFIDREPRSADAAAGRDCELYALSRDEFEQHVQTKPALGKRVFERLASAVASRLRQTNIELRALEDR